jgi:aldose 1-epimerase
MIETVKIIGSSTLEVEVLPEQGARLTRITYQTEKGPIDITPADPTGFQMVPYSNRIRSGKFHFNGVEYLLGNSEKHSNHGVARNQPWVVADQNSNLIKCDFTSIPQFDSKTGIFANYPFPFQASVTYKISEAQLDQVLTVENTGSSPRPVGGGFHPYFRTSLGEMINTCSV